MMYYPMMPPFMVRNVHDLYKGRTNLDKRKLAWHTKIVTPILNNVTNVLNLRHFKFVKLCTITSCRSIYYCFETSKPYKIYRGGKRNGICTAK